MGAAVAVPGRLVPALGLVHAVLSTATGGDNVSTDGNCGANGKTCLNSAFGNCCSEHGWCGATTDHCGTGCQSGFGNCGSSVSNPVPSTTPGDKPGTTNGSCGPSVGTTCANTPWGLCCGRDSQCTNSILRCTIGCQKGYGTCYS
ncbi:hypothetical protein P152DRAFT_10527 [Eremomyces bilateralis CBS 781.70]|uniref:Chitin-binding type-1 domain-containing protein n=1 Tax=Eremomyces bilateralis CBS 781.70 TaxID=1392243 RepID=A0A6G1GGF7_9PEZI|nr:uncharacterized protein P152DRAFT_10527 [Eremomyces bilateralis CBS 781.70]KAF1817187.1 hypothetical protein P152DRAFT_10527 [Eremomyces bilateralis CBS 781.70]